MVLQNIVLIQTMWISDQQKDKKTLMIDSDSESENAHGARECFAFTKEWSEDNILWKLEDFTGVSSVTTECNNPQGVSEITELIFGQPK